MLDGWKGWVAGKAGRAPHMIDRSMEALHNTQVRDVRKVCLSGVLRSWNGLLLSLMETGKVDHFVLFVVGADFDLPDGEQRLACAKGRRCPDAAWYGSRRTWRDFPMDNLPSRWTNCWTTPIESKSSNSRIPGIDKEIA